METTLIVTEKPDAAAHVAEALSGGEGPRRINVDGVPFFEVRANTSRIVVCSAIGHLYAVAAKESAGHSQYPVWDFVWKPKYLIERAQRRQEKWIQAIAKISREAEYFISACDFDLEGSLIGYTILKYACGGADRKAKRMKFSTLTETELRDAYANALPHLDYPLVFAGMCRRSRLVIRNQPIKDSNAVGLQTERALFDPQHRASSRPNPPFSCRTRA